MYWCTDTMARSIYQYRNRPPTGPETTSRDTAFFIKQPVGFSDFPKEVQYIFRPYYRQSLTLYISDSSFTSFLDQKDGKYSLVQTAHFWRAFLLLGEAY